MTRRHRPAVPMAAPVTRETLSSTDARRMQRAKGTQVYWRTVANGRPQGGSYVYAGHDPERDSEDARLAASAWQAVADIQARLRREPPPGPVGEAWNNPACPGCGYTIRCRCPGGA
jgi:hypothetical protein